MGLSIEGGDYRRLLNADMRSCALECRDDVSCLAYEWNKKENVCFLKSRSVSGELVAKPNTLVGFCLDDEDDVRHRMHDHVISGPVLVVAENVPDGDECKQICANVVANYYSWTPNPLNGSIEKQDYDEGNEDDEDEEEETSRLGRCSCIDTMNEVRLEFDSFSGIIPTPKKPRHRREILIFRQT
ncbi:unnamed protein product [Caenorhabditis bovis]|uniref:Apple domain-containing protein n=1 Tax=Caenorhabditis bovis TaxID=2654633 RepID=A0A8S1ETZ2_9PELO|nr:unnamed protein product [Caenorhabditis bovis]